MRLMEKEFDGDFFWVRGELVAVDFQLADFADEDGTAPGAFVEHKADRYSAGISQSKLVGTGFSGPTSRVDSPIPG